MLIEQSKITNETNRMLTAFTTYKPRIVSRAEMANMAQKDPIQRVPTMTYKNKVLALTGLGGL
jgi:hypothetical protein